MKTIALAALLLMSATFAHASSLIILSNPDGQNVGVAEIVKDVRLGDKNEVILLTTNDTDVHIRYFRPNSARALLKKVQENLADDRGTGTAPLLIGVTQCLTTERDGNVSIDCGKLTSTDVGLGVGRFVIREGANSRTRHDIKTHTDSLAQNYHATLKNMSDRELYDETVRVTAAVPLACAGAFSAKLGGAFFGLIPGLSKVGHWIVGGIDQEYLDEYGKDRAHPGRAAIGQYGGMVVGFMFDSLLVIPKGNFDPVSLDVGALPYTAMEDWLEADGSLCGWAKMKVRIVENERFDRERTSAQE